ncbi:zinc finger protein 681-like [Dreissena polymorpha]|uniref:C2H2-type domain-containing protein n=1 Tax=Dreissena polymorpha TaxID=45954 RepID=A0A9D4HD82_DREPO|nr:zinc finger protein 681-like [Dreissena polymorpha]KAH3715475.1 hypothetical protein DPMN_058186 [Dreissena polymorpha]
MCTKGGIKRSMKGSGFGNAFGSLPCVDCKCITISSSKIMDTHVLLLKCGLCCEEFNTICLLHEHLLVYHESARSYIFDYLLQTAFPKLESKCISSQTELFDTFPRDESNAFQHGESYAVGDFQSDNLKCKGDNKYNTEGIVDDLTNLSDITDDYFDQQTLSVDPNLDNIEDKETQKEFKESVKKKRKKKQTKLKTSNNEMLDEQDTSSSKNKRALIDNSTSVKSLIVKNIGCSICKTKFTTKYALLKHENKKHNDLQKFSCDLCNKRFIRQGDYDKHKTYGHSPHFKANKITAAPVKETKCKDKSEKASNSVEVFTKNMETESAVSTTAALKTPYTCDICGHIMPRSKINVHQRLHSGERPFTCNVCGKGLISAAKLKRHMLVHEAVKKHTCELCGAGFNMKYKLAMHMHIHTGKKPYLCSICGAEFNHSSNLATHTRCVHLQVKPYQCKLCGGEYGKRSQLEEHLLRHTSEKLHKCRFCGKSFKHLKGMKRHEKNHLEEKHCLKCDMCDAKFVRKDTLDRHKLVHDKSSVRCPTCKTTYPDQESFKTHKCIENKKDVPKFNCPICDLTIKSENKYLTHMHAIHNLNNELAKKLNSEWKSGKKMDDLLLIHSQKVDPNLPLQSDDNPSSLKSQPVKTSFNVNTVVSSILDENHISIHALTRVATENLRLHSLDIRDDEKAALLPPVNPLTLFEKNTKLAPLDSVGNCISFSTNGASNPHMSGNVYSQHLANIASGRSDIVQNSNIISNQFHGIPFVDHQVYGSNSSLINMGPFVRCSPANLLQMSHIASPSVAEGTLESLRRLQETSDPPISVAIGATSQDRGQASLVGNVQDRDRTCSSSTYHMQHLY